MKKIIRFVPSIIWMVVIFYFSAQQTTGVPGTYTERFVILKSFHLIEYAVLGILLLWAYTKYKSAIITAYLYACTDEIHQLFTPGRTSKFTDTLIDLLGISLGLLTIKYIILPLWRKYRYTEL
ncbi:MAG: VanZ family protein [Candidatus Shapirobacteria bacterium]|nr:VanZ family protein [Candidatus Shapirobacteria bacterium]